MQVPWGQQSSSNSSHNSSNNSQPVVMTPGFLAPPAYNPAYLVPPGYQNSAPQQQTRTNWSVAFAQREQQLQQPVYQQPAQPMDVASVSRSLSFLGQFIPSSNSNSNGALYPLSNY
jgi:hypothetical protein